MVARAVKKMTNNGAQMLLLCLLVLGTFISIRQAYAADKNPFAENYRQQNTNNLKSLQHNPDTKIYISNHKDDDNISMLESGYDMIGSSGFSAIEAFSDLALAHGKAIKADTVLFYRKYESAGTASSKLQLIKEAAKKGGEIDPNDLEEGPTQYRYYASYWAKLPPPLLGVHIIKLQTKASEDGVDVIRDESGLKLIAVIKDSPAAKAGLARGDWLLQMEDVVLNKPDDLFAAVKRYAGQMVTVKLQRDGVGKDLSVELNVRN